MATESVIGYNLVHKIVKCYDLISGENPDRNEYLTPHWVDNKNNAAELRESWIKKSGLALFIYDEISSVSTVAKALTNDYNVAVVFGPQVAHTNKDQIKMLKESYQQKFKLYSLPAAPENHGTLIDNNLFFENYHKPGERYDFALIIENADKYELDDFKERFIEDINLAKEITDVDQVPVCIRDRVPSATA